MLIQLAARLTTGAWLLSDWVVILAAAVSGLAGATFDSLLGATVQAIYRCDRCGTETERLVHGGASPPAWCTAGAGWITIGSISWHRGQVRPWRPAWRS